jgi:PleD family two-component response regulator
MLNLVTGALLGLVLGVGLAFFLEYLQQPESKVDTGYNIIERETGVYNQAYLLLRMKEEMSRTVHTHIAFSLALIRLAYYAPVKGPSLLLPPAKAGRMITAALEQIRRDEDILARLDDKNLCHTTFALLMPNVSETAVQEMLDSLRLKIVNMSVENADSDEKYMVYSVMGIATYQGEQITVQEMLAQATHALAEAETAVNTPIKFYQTTTMLPPITNQIVPEGG